MSDWVGQGDLYGAALRGDPLFNTAVDWVQRQRAQSMAQGLLSPQGWPTSKGVQQGLQAVAMGLGTKDLPETTGLTGGLNPGASGFAERVATRVPPTSAKYPDRPGYVHAATGENAANYEVGLDAYNKTVGTKSPYADNVNEVINHLHPGVPENVDAEGYIQHMVDNLQALYHAMPDWKSRAMNWYEGANAIAGRMATQFNTSTRGAAAVLASLSPKRDWFQNVEQGMRVADIHQNQADTVMTPLMEQTFQKKFNDPEGDTYNPGWVPRFQRLQEGAQNDQPLAQIPDTQDAALWIRLHDATYADHQNFQTVTPEGQFGDLARNQDGTPTNMGWASLPQIGNAVSALRDDSMPNISRAVGAVHKVRNFYNNIISPNAGRDVTIDTHAIAADQLRPLGASSPEVLWGLGTGVPKETKEAYEPPLPDTPSNDTEGLKGTYALHAEAYRRAAALPDINLLPRQLQSMTWEGIRSLFSPEAKRNPTVTGDIDNLWQGVTNGATTPDAARQQIFSRGFADPDWLNPTTAPTDAWATRNSPGAGTPGPAVNP